MSTRVSIKSIAKGLKKSDVTVVPSTDVVRLSFGALIDLSLGQTEDSANYGSVSFGLLRELLVAIVERMGRFCLHFAVTFSDYFLLSSFW